MVKIKTFVVITTIILLLAAILNIAAYQSLEPAFIFLIFCLFAVFYFKFFTKISLIEKVGLYIFFCVFWFWAGVSGMHLNLFGMDTFGPDVSYFYNISNNFDVKPIQKNSIMDEAGAIYLWQLTYEFFSTLGFSKNIYMGVTLNLFLMTLSGLIGLRIVKIVFNDDQTKLKLFIVLYASCGIFWMFASLHLRDAMCVFLLVILLYFWVRFLDEISLINLIKLIIIIFISYYLFGLIRTEFVHVVTSTILAASVALLIKNYKIYVSIFFITLLLISFFSENLSIVNIFRGTDRFDVGSNLESTANSLGSNFVVNQSLPIQLILGSIYLLIFPTPFWVGFGTDSVYHLYKSLNALFMFFLTPLWVLAIFKLYSHKIFRTTSLLFIFFCSVGFIASIAVTTQESRHFGTLLLPMIILSLLPDMKNRQDRKSYKLYLTLFIIFIVLVHILRPIIKILI
jgi:hypothetical protein